MLNLRAQDEMVLNPQEETLVPPHTAMLLLNIITVTLPPGVCSASLAFPWLKLVFSYRFNSV